MLINHIDKQINILILSSVWVEPNSSAAGSRMLQLIHSFLAEGWRVTYASTSVGSEFAFDLSLLGVENATIQLNNISFDDFIVKLNPTIVLFDRFMMEEQFGWRVAEKLPNALRILDTEDLHCLRKAREVAITENKIFQETDILKTAIAKREIASILRCDLSLIISKYEKDVLQNTFKIDSNILQYTPFLLDKINSLEILPKYLNRKDFYFIGNFLHKPNYDAVLYLKKEIWPLIAKKLPKSVLYIYGSYPSQKVLQLNNVKERFIIKGKIPNTSILKKHKVCLAPLRFGAGIKGKLTEAMQYGTPSVTTSIGAESMYGTLPWNGFIENKPVQFALASINLYTNAEVWEEAQKKGFEIINKIYNKELHSKLLIDKIKQLLPALKLHREANFLGELLQYHTLKSTKYLSKWIEEKNHKK